jgi:bifunctional DNA-binding transcriptional regulator/antitoxin component of YhaV-PrlF toxin-antitoxin module
MVKAIVNVAGQILIPDRIRRRLGIKKRLQVCVYEQDGAIVITPISDAYLRKMAGVTGTKGKLLRALMEEKTMARHL